MTPSAGERLIPLVRARGVKAIDLRTALVAAAAHGEVYSKAETHWNDAGAYVAYREIVRELRAAGVRDTIVPSSLEPRTELDEADLDRLAGISSVVRDEVIRYDFPRHARGAAEETAHRIQRGEIESRRPSGFRIRTAAGRGCVRCACLCATGRSRWNRR